MARRPNYGGEKRQKEIQRQKKREEKAEKKRLKKEEASPGDQTDSEGNATPQPTTDAGEPGEI